MTAAIGRRFYRLRNMMPGWLKVLLLTLLLAAIVFGIIWFLTGPGASLIPPPKPKVAKR